MPTDGVLEVNALPSEMEEQDRVDAWTSLGSFPDPLLLSARPPIAGRSPPARSRPSIPSAVDPRPIDPRWPAVAAAVPHASSTSGPGDWQKTHRRLGQALRLPMLSSWVRHPSWPSVRRDPDADALDGPATTDLVERSSRTPLDALSPPSGVGPSRIAFRTRIPPAIHFGFPCPRDRDRVDSRRVEQEPRDESDYRVEPWSMKRWSRIDRRSPDRPAVDPRPVVPRPVGPAQPKKSLVGRLLRSLMLTAVLVGGVVFGLYKMRVEHPAAEHQQGLRLLGLRRHVQPSRSKRRVVGKYEGVFPQAKGERGGGPPRRPQDRGHQPDRPRTSPSPRNTSARSGRATTSMSARWRMGISSHQHQGGPGGQDGRRVVRDPAGPLQGEAGRRDRREGLHPDGAEQHEAAWPKSKRSPRTR